MNDTLAIAAFVIGTAPAERTAAIEEAIRKLAFSLRAVCGAEHAAAFLNGLAEEAESRIAA